jgi:hypothetical protein
MIFIYAKEFSKPYHQTLIGIFPTAEDYIACKDSLECRCNDLDGYLHQEHLTDRGIYIEPGKNKNLAGEVMPIDLGLTESMEALENFISKYKRG